MGTGQLVLALGKTVPLAVAGRVLVGAGDAMTFISVIRLIPVWFAPERVPLLTQMTGILGQIGQIAAAYPLVALLQGAGWTTSFTVAAAVAFAGGVVAATMLRNTPPGTPVLSVELSVPEVLARLAHAWREPGTRLGLWTHFVTQFSGVVFALLWGYPFLVVGEHRTPGEAGLLLTLLVVVAMFVAPVLGSVATRFPYRRSVPTLTIVFSTAAVWTLVLLWPGRAPMAVLVLLVVVLASNGPGSMMGFDYARTENEPERIGSASGIVNVGGFIASLCTIALIGVILSAQNSGGPTTYTLTEFKRAFAVQYAFWAIGLIGVLVTRRRLRRKLELTLVPFPVAVWRRYRR
jgi:MFS family permease